MRVLVIGGTEFISLHLVRALQRDGHEVCVLNRGRNPARLPARVRTLVCDRKDHAPRRVRDHALPIPSHEDTPRALYWGEYAKNKIEGEDACLRRHRERGLPVTIVRPTHVYGPLNTRNNETFFCDRLVRGRPVLVPGAGGWLRQFRHVEDLADAMARLLGAPAALGRAYNVSGEEAITQVRFIELIADVIKRPLTRLHVATPRDLQPLP